MSIEGRTEKASARPMVTRSSTQVVVVLMGVSGCGKSTVGRRLASQLGCPFIDADDFHDAASIEKMKSGISLTDDDRWPWLDRIGHALQTAVAERGAAVASCSALKKVYRDRLASAVEGQVSFVLLEVSHAQLLARLNERTDHFMPASLLESQLATLERPSHSERALVLNADASPVQLCESIREWLKLTITQRR